MRGRRASWVVLGMAVGPLLALALAALAGCPRPVPPPPPPPDGMAACPAATAPQAADVCDSMFTPDGDACVNCGTIGPCFDATHAVYCAAPGGCTRDPLCRLDAAASIKRRRAVKHEAH